MDFFSNEAKPLIGPNKFKNKSKNIIKVVRMYKCILCDEKFANKTILAEHKLTHTTTIKPFECLYCDYKSSLKDILKNHVQNQHGIAIKRSEIISQKKYEVFVQEYKCTICNEQFASKRSLHEHHLINKTCMPFGCAYCFDKTTPKDLRDLIKIKNESNEEISIKEEAGTDDDLDGMDFERATNGELKPTLIYKCTSCNMQFYSKSSLYRHNLTHYGSKPLGCQYCDYRCGLKGIMKNHLEIRHGVNMKLTDILPDKKDKMYIRAYKCATCDKVLPTKGHLQIHLNVSKQCKTYKCTICEYRSMLKNTMKRHMQMRHRLNVDTLEIHPATASGSFVAQDDIKMDIGSNEIFPDVSVKEEIMTDDEQLSDEEIKYNISTDDFLNESFTLKVEKLDRYSFAGSFKQENDNVLDDFIKEKVTDDLQ